jgi:hypothetical protein
LVQKTTKFVEKKITPSNAVMGNCALISEKRENQRSLQMLLKYLCTTSHQGIFFQFEDIENLVNISKDFPVLLVNNGQNILRKKHTASFS